MFLDTVPVASVYTIAGRVWDDSNCDGSPDGEPGLGGAVVALSSGLTQTTANDGWFTLYAPPGVITVTSTPPGGYIPTNAIPGDAAFKNDNVTLVVNLFLLEDEHLRTSQDNLFGNALDSGPFIISGTVFDDETCNGVFDAGDTGLEGVSVTYQFDESGDSFITQTDSNGYYEFSWDCGPCAEQCERGTITCSGPGVPYTIPTTPGSIIVNNPTGVYPNNNFGYSDGCP
jgi:hypothetical protein